VVCIRRSRLERAILSRMGLGLRRLVESFLLSSEGRRRHEFLHRGGQQRHKGRWRTEMKQGIQRLQQSAGIIQGSARLWPPQSHRSRELIAPSPSAVPPQRFEACNPNKLHGNDGLFRRSKLIVGKLVEPLTNPRPLSHATLWPTEQGGRHHPSFQ
jgi:hypothetical protein